MKGIAVTEAESPVKEISVRGADGVMEEMVFDVDRFIQRYIKIKPHQ